MRKTFILLAVVFVAISPSLISILHSGFFATDDGNWMVIRLSAFYEALRSGQFPVRFLPRLNNSYGYPVVDFLYPLFLYLGSVIHAFHLSYVLTIKILFGISFIASGVGCFFWLRKKFSDKAAIVGSSIYALFPYHLWDMTKRGSLGEVLAMGIVPFIFWSIEIKSVLLTGLFIGLLILAHNSLAVLFFPVIIGYLFIEKKIKMGIVSTILGLGLSAFFWVPALADRQFTVFDKTVVSQYSQYFLTWDLYKLTGVISLAIVFLYILVHKKINKLDWFLVSVLAVSLFFTLSISNIFWQIFKLGTFIQFPFRFLSVTGLCIGFLGALVTNGWGKNYLNFFVVSIFIILYLSSYKYFFPNSYSYYEDSFYSTNQATTTVQNEYMPIYVKSQISNLPFGTLRAGKSQKIDVIKGEANITNQKMRGTSIEFSVTVKSPTILQVNFVYFPGWMAKVDGLEYKLIPNSLGLMNITVSKGLHNIKIWFGETPLRFFADIFSLLSAIILVLGLIFRKNFVKLFRL